MKKIISAIVALSLMTMFSACKKEVSVNDPATETQAEALKADDAKPAEAKADDVKAADAKADDAKAADAKADDAKPSAADDNKAPDMDKKDAAKDIILAIDLCKIGEIPEDTNVKNVDIKKAFADCKAGKAGRFGLKLGERYSFDLGMSSLNFELEQFPKHDKIEDAIQEINSMAQYKPKNVKIEAASDLSKKLGVEVKKCTYTIGGNEDTMFHEDYYYNSGDHDYRLGMSMHEDELEALKDKVVENLVGNP